MKPFDLRGARKMFERNSATESVPDWLERSQQTLFDNYKFALLLPIALNPTDLATMSSFGS